MRSGVISDPPPTPVKPTRKPTPKPATTSGSNATAELKSPMAGEPPPCGECEPLAEAFLVGRFDYRRARARAEPEHLPSGAEGRPPEPAGRIRLHLQGYLRDRRTALEQEARG